ncbi:MAG: sigma 54-interacting transcriptional regulator [Acidobacteriota bacterium]
MRRDSDPGRYLPATGLEDFVQALEAWLPAGWETSLQMEEPLTHTLEEVASSLDAVDTSVLALTVLPDAFTETPDPWMLERLGFGQCHVFPIQSERPIGRLLLLAGDTAPRLGKGRRQQIRDLCDEAAGELERARAHREDEKFSVRLRKITETELAIRFARAALAAVPRLQAVAVFAQQDDQLKVIEVRTADGRRIERHLYARLPLAETHLQALLQRSSSPVPAILDPDTSLDYTEGRHLRQLIGRLGLVAVETVPLVSADRLVGSAQLFHPLDGPSSQERSGLGRLADALAVSLDRSRPERRQASSLLYLQGLLRSSRGALMPVLRTVVEEIVSFLGADAGVLALIDGDTGRILLSEHMGYARDALLPEFVPKEEGTSILAHVVRTGEPFVASDAATSKIYLPVDPAIRSEIAVPMRLHGETVGVALASSRIAGAFHADDVSRFQLLADQVSVAVDDARLLDALRAERETLAVERQRRHYGLDPSLHAEDVEYHFGNLVGDPKGPMGDVYRTIERVAAREQDIVLVLGETGTGKEMVAHALHSASPRADRALVATNFAALGGDPNLIQSELFGHEKGSFTGAVRRRRGCFEKAHRSTLLIDELGDIVPSVQVKLLRVLGRTARRDFERLGGDETISADVRVLAATNKDLRIEMQEGRFREDLYYRLSALMVRIPPLRERPDDIPLLVRHFLPRFADGRPIRMGRGALDALRAHPFPGNVRQLESVLLRALVMFGAPDALHTDDVQRALAIETGDEASAFRLPEAVLECPAPPVDGWFWHAVHEPYKERLIPPDAVRALLQRHLSETGGFYTRVAERFGVDRGDYQRFLDFLKHADLKVDHRPHRVGKKKNPELRAE